ncbi:hypothetical protein F4859DRAFT_13009 [Xylaria cf. heliscus]|nr:hypothetical protein F4859DRAFT_13009 [Xylaria cf. heliscus]
MAGADFNFDLPASIRKLTCAPQTRPINMTESPHHYTIHSDINHRRTLPLSDATPTLRRHQFYDTDDLRAVAPQGFSSLAAMQTKWSNTGTFRTFDYLNWRRLQFYETKLTYLEGQLHRLDIAEAKMIKDGSQKSKVPFNKEIFMDCCLEGSEVSYLPETLAADCHVAQDEFTDLREKLYAHIERVSTKHHELVGWMQQASTSPRVHRAAHNQLFTAARELHRLDGEAIEHLRAIDDMAYVSLNPIDSRLQSFWLSTTPWVKKILILLCLRNPLPDNDGSQTYNAVEVYRFRFLLKTVVTLSTTLLSSSLLLLPAGILYLAGLSRPLSFAVVVIFGVVFAIALMLIEHRIGHAVVGVIAYIAVLATFLANVT